MAHIYSEDRSHLPLLPNAVDDYVGPDSPARFIDAFLLTASTLRTPDSIGMRRVTRAVPAMIPRIC